LPLHATTYANAATYQLLAESSHITEPDRY